MKKKVKITRIKIDVRVLALLIFLTLFFKFFLRWTTTPKYLFVKNGMMLKCPIIYSRIECYNNRPLITFKNPSKMNYTNIQVIVPKNGEDIYIVSEPLFAKDIKSLFFNFSCGNIKEEKIRFRWCCKFGCYEILLKNPKPIILLERRTLEECENLSIVKKLFCYANVAEITNNISICYLIDDNDISALCFAKLTLNKTQCLKIKDEPLKNTCLQSVETKIKWKKIYQNTTR